MHCLTGNEDDPDTFTTMKMMMPMMMMMIVMMLTMMMAHMAMKSMSAIMCRWSRFRSLVMRMDDDTSTPMMNTMPKMMMMFDVHHVNEINVSKDAFRGCAATEHVQGCVSICPSD